MTDVRVEPVVSRRQRRQFLELPWTLYRGDQNWIPPLRDSQKEMVGFRPHPFHLRNAVQTFIATHGGQVCGRIAGILNRGHIERYHDPRGFFGFFECIDDQEVANGLFEAVRWWFADQGIYRLRGPTNPSLNYELGLLIDGFDSPPTFMMTYNPPYYARLIEGCGFRKTQDMYAFWGDVDMLPRVAAKLGPVAEQIIQRYGVNLRPLDRKRFREDVEAFLSVYNCSLVNTWGFVPMSPEEVRHTARALRYLMVPELAVGAEIDGKIIGAAFGLPDYNPRIREIDGRLFPFGFFHLLRRKRDIKRVRILSTNVLPEYQRLGVGLTLMHALAPMAEKWGLREAEFSWVLESNSLSYGSLKKGGAKITKTYRLYDFDAEPAQATSPAAVAPARPLIRRPARTVPGALEIREAQSRADLDRFIRLPWRIYEGNPHWVPPLLIEVKEFLNPRKHPFYRHGSAAKFLAFRGSQPVGRILASDDPNYNREQGTSVGHFGMFECFEDPEAAQGLLEAAASWLRGRGRTSMFGPIDYSTNYPCGLLVEGFDTPPRVMMNHNPTYYEGLLESWGLRKTKDLYAWWFVDPHDLVAKWQARVERIVRRTGVVVRPFRKSQFEADVDRCRTVYNTAMRDQWGFVKLTEAEFQYFADRLARLAIAEQVLLAELDDQPVGFSITLPDVNEAIRPLNGRLSRYGLPVGLLRLAYRTRHIKTARMLVLDVLQGYRRRGVAELLILRTLDHGKHVLGYTGAELSWTLEDNDLVNRTIQTVGGRRYKTYRIYEKGIGE